MKVTAVNKRLQTDSKYCISFCLPRQRDSLLGRCAWQEVQQKQQQYEHERLEKEREESAAPAAEPLPVR